MATQRKKSAKSSAKKRTTTKKKTRYSKTKNVGLKKEFFSKIKQEYHDIDYYHTLDDKSKDWLSRFMQEDLGANFTHKGKRIYRKKKDEKACYDRNNARQRDIYGIAKATGKTVDIDFEIDNEDVDESYEDRIIKLIDESDDL